MYPTDAYNDQQVETRKTEAKDAYISTALLSALNHNRYGNLMNTLHINFRMIQNEYPKDLTTAYDLTINWKKELTSMAIIPINGLDFLTDDRVQDEEVHTTDEMVTNVTC